MRICHGVRRAEKESMEILSVKKEAKLLRQGVNWMRLRLIRATMRIYDGLSSLLFVVCSLLTVCQRWREFAEEEFLFYR